MCCGAEQRGRSGGSCTAPGLQHSVCCVMETPAFNYGGCKTLLSVCVCVCVTSLPLCLLHRWWEMFQLLLATAWDHSGFSLSQAGKLGWVLLALSAREGLDHLHLHAFSGARVCLGLSVCPWSQPLTHPCSSAHFCRYCQNQMSWALGHPGSPESCGVLAIFKAQPWCSLLYLRWWSDHHPAAVSGGSQGEGEENQWRKHFSV